MFNPNIPVSGHHGRDPIIIDDDSSDDDDNGGMQVEYTTGPLHHQSGYRYPQSDRRGGGGASLSNYHISAEQEKKVRGRLREERHAALCVLMDRELLTVQALAAQETLPQARRRFLSKLMAPEDPEAAASIRADRFIIQHPAGPSSPLSSSATVPMTVNRSIVDVHETDDAGWHRPEKALSSSSPASSKTRGKMTPDRARNKGKALSSSSSRQQQQQRERRRRWSGAERED